MPLSGPTIATASLMLFIHQWDAFFWPLVAASREELAVVQVAIARNMTLEQANTLAEFKPPATHAWGASAPVWLRAPAFDFSPGRRNSATPPHFLPCARRYDAPDTRRG